MIEKTVIKEFIHRIFKYKYHHIGAAICSVIYSICILIQPETISLIKLRKQIDDLIFVTKLGNKNMLIDKLKEIVPTYYSPDFYNKKKLVEEVAATTLGGKE